MAKAKSNSNARVSETFLKMFSVKGNLGRKTSMDKDRIMTDPKFQGTRENMAEFTACVLASTSMRKGLAEILTSQKAKKLHTRLNKLFRTLLNAHKGKRGQRSIELQANLGRMIGLELLDNGHLISFFSAPRTMHTNPERNEVCMEVPSFGIHTHLNMPGGATHFRLCTACISLSDIVWNQEQERHLPANELLNGIGAVEYSELINLNQDFTKPILLTAKLPNAPTLGKTEVLLGITGIEFFQQVNNEIFEHWSGNAFRVEAGF